MDAMLQPGQKCDFTCFCDRSLEDFETYYLIRQHLGDGDYSVVFCCEHCGNPHTYTVPWIWPRVRFRVSDGHPVPVQ